MFFAIVNELGLLYLQNGNPLVPFLIGENGVKNTFLTFKEHVGLHPGVCILPKPPFSLIFLEGTENINSQEDDILDIFVNINYILEKYREIDSKEDANATVYDFVKSVLDGVQVNLGNINYFDLHPDTKKGIEYFHIVDRKVIPDKKNIKTTIDVVGLLSEVSNLNIVSKLSNNITSMIAIAAQDTFSPSSAQDLYNVQKWNNGLRNRHILLQSTKEDDPSSKIDPEDIKDKELKNKLEEYIGRIYGTTNNLSAGVLPDPTGLSSIHRQVMNEYVRKYTTLEKTNPPGLIPFELSFTIKGISGIKVGQAFRINDFFLPQRYKGNVGFIVTGVDHTVSESKWTTEIKSQMIFI